MNAIKYLLSIETKGIKLGFKRTCDMMEACGNPHLDFPVIQVVGTNGKGSVCAILASILKTANYKTGLYTSPHLMHINERIRINGKVIPNIHEKLESLIDRQSEFKCSVCYDLVISSTSTSCGHLFCEYIKYQIHYF